MTQKQINQHKVRLFTLAIYISNGWAEEAAFTAREICRLCALSETGGER